MFAGFQAVKVTTTDVAVNLVIGGTGPPVLLLHGYPQTHAMWHAVAPALARDLTVVAADLRGYGDSSKPESGDDHAAYSKRAMAQDQVEAMAGLGFDAFAVVGHDRGGRVAHRMALDHPERVTRLAVLDIVPTHTVFSNVSQALATDYYHWFFLIQPYDFPERLIGADPDYYLEHKLGSWSAGYQSFAPEALAEYRRCFRDPATIHASCEDYRAAASIDLEHDEVDLDRKVACPLMALWGDQGRIAQLFDVLETWRERASDVRGRALKCGHFPAEETARETADELRAFLTAPT